MDAMQLNASLLKLCMDGQAWDTPCGSKLKCATHAPADLALNVVGYAFEVLLQFGQGPFVLLQLAELLGLGHLSQVSL
jgi:hypothetical protein